MSSKSLIYTEWVVGCEYCKQRGRKRPNSLTVVCSDVSPPNIDRITQVEWSTPSSSSSSGFLLLNLFLTPFFQSTHGREKRPARIGQAVFAPSVETDNAVFRQRTDSIFHILIADTFHPLAKVVQGCFAVCLEQMQHPKRVRSANP